MTTNKKISIIFNKTLKEFQNILCVVIKKLNPPPSTLNPQAGQMLIESIVAISVTITGLLGIFALLSSSLAANKAVSRKFVATYLASEGIEVVRSIIDANYTATPRRPWNDGIVSGAYEVMYNSATLGFASGQHLRLDPSLYVYNYSGSVETQFVRTIVVDAVSASEIKVNSVVNWPDGSVDIEDHFFDWRL